MAFRAGAGRTVRGHEHGTQRGQAVWSVQVEVPTGRRWFHPVLFADAGQAGPLSGLDGLRHRRVLAGVGVGFRLVGGLLWVDRAEPITARP
jgi:hemolysin activation/secretion protein